jgi:hypothetical protein
VSTLFGVSLFQGYSDFCLKSGLTAVVVDTTLYSVLRINGWKTDASDRLQRKRTAEAGEA